MLRVIKIMSIQKYLKCLYFKPDNIFQYCVHKAVNFYSYTFMEIEILMKL